MKYQLLQIVSGVETILLDTDDKTRIRRCYHRVNNTRIRLEGRMLRIFEADAWAAGKRIPLPEGERKARMVYGPRPVYLVDAEGNVLAWYKNLKVATAESGFKCGASIKASCDSGEPTSKGTRYRWANE